jgi:colicin import membrane protein
MTRKAETRQLTETAFWAILGSGAAPTVDSVNAWLDENGHGRRDRAVINETLKACWAKAGERIAKVNTLPGIPEEVVQLVLKLRDDMLALAQQQFESDVAEIQRTADARVAAAQADATAARAAADQAAQTAREHAAALLTLQEEHQRVIGEGRSLRSQLEEASRNITTRDVQLGQAREALEREQREREQDRVIAHDERKRMSLELDQLRTANTAQTRAFERTIDKAQQQLDAAASRERELREENTRLQAEIGSLRGAQEVLKALNTELAAERDQSRSDASANAERAATANEKAQQAIIRFSEAQHEISTLASVTPEQLEQLLADAYLAGAGSMNRSAKGKDPVDGLSDRASEYAARHTAPTISRK